MLGVKVTIPNRVLYNMPKEKLNDYVKKEALSYVADNHLDQVCKIKDKNYSLEFDDYTFEIEVSI